MQFGDINAITTTYRFQENIPVIKIRGKPFGVLLLGTDKKTRYAFPAGLGVQNYMFKHVSLPDVINKGFTCAVFKVVKKL